MQHSRSAISVASTISVVPSESHEFYRRHIVVAIDNSSTSKHALEWTIKTLYKPGDKFHLVHVIPEPPTLHLWPGVYIPPDDAPEKQEFHEASMLIQHGFAPILLGAKVPTDVHLIVAPDAPGSIATLLVDKMEELEAACLVVASHDKQTWQEFWSGSVTKDLKIRCNFPLVVYRHCK